MKILKWTILVLVVLVIVAGVVVYLNLNRIVRRTVETQATDSLNLPTTVGGASVSLFGGKVSLTDFAIGSPPGFAAPQMFTMSRADVGVSYGQLRDDPMHVGDIEIRKPTLVVEQSGGRLNVQTLMDQPSKQTPSNGDGKREPNEPLKLIVDHLRITDATVVMRGIPGLQKEVTVAVPTLDLDNIGTGEGNQNGAAIKDIVMQVVTALAAKGTDLGNLPDQIKQQINGQLQGIATKLNKQFEKQLGGKLPLDLEKTIDKGLGDVLGGKKESRKPATQP